MSRSDVERTLADGPAVLSNAELLSVLGVAPSRATNLLAVANGVHGLAVMDALELRSLGLPSAQTARVLAAIELGRRVLAPGDDRIVVRGPEDVVPTLMARIGHLEHEELVLVSLDRRRRVIAIDTLTAGSRAFTIVDPSQVFRQALKRNADAVIIAHNHPSQVATPSSEDVSVTRRLASGAHVIGIELLDHLVITTSGWASLAEHIARPAMANSCVA